MIIWPGIELIGCPRGTSKKCGVVQGVIYTVVDMSEENIVLQMRPEYCQRRHTNKDDDANNEKMTKKTLLLRSASQFTTSHRCFD